MLFIKKITFLILLISLLCLPNINISANSPWDQEARQIYISGTSFLVVDDMSQIPKSLTDTKDYYSDAYDTMWHNHFYIKVINKYSDKYVFYKNDISHSNSIDQYVVEALVLKSYNEVGNVTNSLDEFIKETILINMSKPQYDKIYNNCEYLIRLVNTSELRNMITGENEIVFNADLNFRHVLVLDNRLVLDERFIYNKKFNYPYNMNPEYKLEDIGYGGSTKYYYGALLNELIFDGIYTKLDIGFNYYISYTKNWGDSSTEYTNYILRSDIPEYDENVYYQFEQYQCCQFIRSGDNISRFEEYIKFMSTFDTSKTLYPSIDSLNK